MVAWFQDASGAPAMARGHYDLSTREQLPSLPTPRIEPPSRPRGTTHGRSTACELHGVKLVAHEPAKAGGRTSAPKHFQGSPQPAQRSVPVSRKVGDHALLERDLLNFAR